MIARKTTALLSAATGATLLGGVAIRLIEDSRLFASARADAFAAALLASEVVPLAIAVVLGLAGTYIGRLTWTGRLRRRLPIAMVFGSILLIGILAVRGSGPGAFFGSVLALLSGATLFVQFRLPRTSQA